MSGPDLAKKLMKERAGLRIMMMTGYTGGDLLVLNYGWQLITKPFVPALLREKVDNVLHSPNRSQGTDHFDSRE
jgi:DNA-binding response OmpR family regulator